MISFSKSLSRKILSKEPKPQSKSTDDDHGYVANKWEVLMGKNHWQGLLNPLDIDLRRIVIHYGEMAQATIDTFIRDDYSKYAGASHFSKENLLAKVGLEIGHPYKYKVTKFIYATSAIDVPNGFILKSLYIEPWSKESNFMGYIAVADDKSVELLGRREIVVAWRGTVRFSEWYNDFQFMQVSASTLLGYQGSFDGQPHIHQGWYSIYTTQNLSSPYEKTSAREQVLTELRRLVELYKDEEISITVTGHSLGAALATLNAVDIVANKVNKPKTFPNVKSCMVTAIVLASPRVGDSNFKKLLTKYDELRILRVRNALDIVPNYPLIGYSDVGEELMINTSLSPYVKNPSLPWVAHNLEVYMHGVAGVQGNEGGFKLVVDRDIVLMNKFFDILKDKYLVPVGWWVLKNKGMVQQSDGSWMLMDHEIDDDNE